MRMLTKLMTVDTNIRSIMLVRLIKITIVKSTKTKSIILNDTLLGLIQYGTSTLLGITKTRMAANVKSIPESFLILTKKRTCSKTMFFRIVIIPD